MRRNKGYESCNGSSFIYPTRAEEPRSLTLRASLSTPHTPAGATNTTASTKNTALRRYPVLPSHNSGRQTLEEGRKNDGGKQELEIRREGRPVWVGGVEERRERGEGKVCRA